MVKQHSGLTLPRCQVQTKTSVTSLLSLWSGEKIHQKTHRSKEGQGDHSPGTITDKPDSEKLMYLLPIKDSRLMRNRPFPDLSLFPGLNFIFVFSPSFPWASQRDKEWVHYITPCLPLPSPRHPPPLQWRVPPTGNSPPWTSSTQVPPTEDWKRVRKPSGKT